MFFTLNLRTSSMLAVLPWLTQDLKKEGATDTPRASAVIPVLLRSAFVAITLPQTMQLEKKNSIKILMQKLELIRATPRHPALK